MNGQQIVTLRQEWSGERIQMKLMKQTGHAGQTKEHGTQDRTMETATSNNNRPPTTEAQRFKYTDKQAKQDNKGAGKHLERLIN